MKREKIPKTSTQNINKETVKSRQAIEGSKIQRKNREASRKQRIDQAQEIKLLKKEKNDIEKDYLNEKTKRKLAENKLLIKCRQMEENKENREEEDK